MEKYISDIRELNLGRCISGGSCSKIYEMGNGILFKEFEEDYQDLSDSINIEFYEVIKFLSGLKGMPYIVRGKDIYRSSDKLYGYSMTKIDASQLHSISDDVLVEDVFNGFKVLGDDVRVLADNHVKTEDVGGDNILFNDFMYLIDLDLSLVDGRYIPDELYESTMNSLLFGVRSKLLGSDQVKDYVPVEFIDSYLNSLRNMCSEGLGREVKTINDMRCGYQKIKTYH